MSDLTDNLRAGLASLADEVTPVDLHERALRSSRRLAARRAAVTSAAAVLLAGALTTSVLALPLPPDGSPVPPVGSSPPATGSPSPAPTPTPTPSPSPSPGSSPSSAPPTGSPSPAAPTEPAGAEIPVAAMLQPADFGPDYRASDDAPPHHGSLSMLMAYCGQQINGDEYGTLANRSRDFTSGEDNGEGEYAGQQEVHRYEPDGAAGIMANLRDALPQCQQVNVGGSPDHVSELTVLDSGFAGDESLLVEDVYTTPDATTTRYHLAIRQGDLYTQVILLAGPPERVLALGKAAAGRLCEATPAC